LSLLSLNATPTTRTSTLPLHDALPICRVAEQEWDLIGLLAPEAQAAAEAEPLPEPLPDEPGVHGRPTARELLAAVRDHLTEDVIDRKSTRLNSSHVKISYAVFCLKKKK